MNTDEVQFDRLVDDELSEEERRELLGRLDDEPGGWRRCALAFLESQCWRQALGEMPSVRESLGAIFRPGEKTTQPPAVPVKSTQRTPWLGHMKVLSAMAASFLLALWAGNVAHHAWLGRSGSPAGVTIAAADNANRPLIAANDHRKTLVGSPWQAGSAASPVRLVTVSSLSDGPHPRASIQLPAIERNGIDEQWLRSVPPAIPENVLQALARTGHQVQQQREFVPVPLQDGRQLVVPVDRVNVHYVGNGPY